MESVVKKLQKLYYYIKLKRLLNTAKSGGSVAANQEIYRIHCKLNEIELDRAIIS